MNLRIDRISRTALLAILIGICSISQAFSGSRHALVIGNSEYANSSFLKNAVSDAQDVAGELRSLDFEVDLGLNVDREDFTNLVAEFRSKAAHASDLIFYYAGHGFQLHGLNHLVPIDADLKVVNYLPYETLQLNQILTTLRSSSRQTLVVLLDACRNNPLPENLRGEKAEDGLAQLQEADGAYVVFATQPGNVSRDGKGRNSPFAAALVAYMGKAGLSISEMMIDVRREVKRLTDGTQVPWELSTLSENFYFNTALYGVDAENDDVLSSVVAVAPLQPTLERVGKPETKPKIAKVTEAKTRATGSGSGAKKAATVRSAKKAGNDGQRSNKGKPDATRTVRANKPVDTEQKSKNSDRAECESVRRKMRQRRPGRMFRRMCAGL